MNQKIESIPPVPSSHGSEFSPGFVRALVLLAIATLVMVFIVDPVSFRRYDKMAAVSPYPWIVAGGQTISMGLSEFSGKELEPPSTSQRYGMLISILLAYIIGPTLFFLGWRRLRLEREANPNVRGLRVSQIPFLLGAIMTVTVAAPIVPIALLQLKVSAELRSAQAIQRNRDYIINELNQICKEAFQYKILPKQFGGGAGSYADYRLSSDAALTDHAHYELVGVTPDQVVVSARSTKYDNASVTVTIDGAGRLRGWTYLGVFQ